VYISPFVFELSKSKIKFMSTLLSSPTSRANEMQMVYQRIEACSSIDEMNYASKLVDLYQESNPQEKEVIQSMRDLVCDLTFKFYLERYPSQK
jgi:hypothetical protein